MIGIVVVSHSPALARAAVDLALEMVGDAPPSIALAAGAGDDESGAAIIGTDATRVSDAIDEVASPDGVLVLMDLGSAVLSAEMALEFASATCEVRLSDAPFVEGLVAAVVLAAAGASLDDVAREASGAMEAKRGQLGTARPAESSPPPAVQTPVIQSPDAAADVTLVNADGLHARPAATLVKAVSAFDATVTITAPGRAPISASSLIAVLSFGAAKGTVLRVEATGPQASEAVEAVRAMAADGFGE